LFDGARDLGMSRDIMGYESTKHQSPLSFVSVLIQQLHVLYLCDDVWLVLVSSVLLTMSVNNAVNLVTIGSMSTVVGESDVVWDFCNKSKGHQFGRV
jgi:hypothetical protein